MNLKRKLAEGFEVLDTRGGFDPETRARYMNASEADRCLREQWFEKNRHHDGTPKKLGFARRGHAVEDQIVKSLVAAGVPIRYAGEDQRNIRSDKYRIAATPDGELVEDGLITFTEFKSIDPRVNVSNLPKQEHITQVRIGMDLRQQELREGNSVETVVGAWIIYVNCSNFDEVYTFFVDYRSGVVENYSRRAERLFTAKHPDDLPAEGIAKGGKSGGCKYCRFHHMCSGFQGELQRPDPNAGDLQRLPGERGLLDLLDEISSLKPVEASLKAKTKELKEGMSELQLAALTSEDGSHKAFLSKRSGAKRLDKEALAAALVDTDIDLDSFYNEGPATLSLTIKEEKE